MGLDPGTHKGPVGKSKQGKGWVCMTREPSVNLESRQKKCKSISDLSSPVINAGNTVPILMGLCPRRDKLRPSSSVCTGTLLHLATCDVGPHMGIEPAWGLRSLLSLPQ